MPTQQFLDDFLPISCIPSYSQPRPFWKGCFQTTLDATDELKMYDPFIESISPFAPQLHFVNSHSLGDKDNGYPFETKPDISTNTLGQIGAYATSQLASQFRTHCYSVYVNRDHARIIRWERDGAIVTEPIFYNINSALTRFFSR
ncbi:hypothetical protein SCLCIDRAFT_142098 [Scleroderma citrinum Foug A]|uniref:Fungal-type protein kinase domain-containing protein n=1 Tax=Scleroderma citrinum Foug A TaxID=1036808 RepID=A0A0C2ZGU3_9AGAM|nr:hypothetical protein SCLCIDRAFT_142098 [Scleroderma citrinum Foug A]